MKLRTLTKEKIENKKVLLRVDFNVPMENGKITDDQKIKETLPTIKFLLENKASIIIVSHLGRPTPTFDFTTQPDLSLEPIAHQLENLLGEKVDFINDIVGEVSQRAVKELKPGQVILFQNLRFDAREKEGDEDFAKELASLAEIYVNDAFAVSHRAHASLYQVTKFIPHYAGFRMQREVKELSRILENPARPLVVITGGVKLETKLPIVKNMHGFADYILVGGRIADQVRVLFKEQHHQTKRKSILLVADLTEDKNDITKKSAENFAQIIKTAKTVVWNGPLGYMEKGFNKGSKIVGDAIIDSKAYSVAGGGETGVCSKQLGIYDKFSFISTGGGAMLDFLSGQELPAIKPLLE